MDSKVKELFFKIIRIQSMSFDPVHGAIDAFFLLLLLYPIVENASPSMQQCL